MIVSLVRRKLDELLQGQKFDLPYLLESAHPQTSYEERVEWMVRLVDWLRYGVDEGRNVSTRIRFLLQLLERNPKWKLATALTIRSVISETRALRSFSELGLPTDSTFLREIMRRFFHVLLPHALEDRSLEGVLLNVFYHDEDPVWLSELSSELRLELVKWLRTGLSDVDPIARPWVLQASEAMVVLSTRIAGICFLEEMRARAPDFPVDTHPSLKLQDLLQQLHLSVLGKKSFLSLDLEGVRKEFHTQVQAVRTLMMSVRNHMEEQGISVNLVYQVDRVKLSLERIEVLGNWVLSSAGTLHEQRGSAASLEAATNVMNSLAWGSHYDSDFKFVFRKGAVLLSRKIVERTGETGEHFITQTPAEWRKMFGLAAGGGALTAGTAFFKYVVVASNWPPFLEIVYHATNYSLSFLLMHFAGFKLATKQPSMTAATLAGRLKDDLGSDESFVEEIARVSRSQFAAVMGNVLVVIPVALLVDFLYRLMRHGNPFLSAEKAMYVVQSIHPLTTLTLLYAGWTGVLLWLSSMIAGWCENAIVFYELRKVLIQQRNLKKILGVNRLERLAESLLKHASGVAGAVSLGILLAVSPAVGSFFGLPLDVRHVTLTSGSLTYAWSSLGIQSETWVLLVTSGLSVLFIALLNFGVSFALATLVAFRAREVSLHRFWVILKIGAARFLSRPREFLFPGRGPNSHET